MTLFNTHELRPEIAAIVESDKLFTKLPTSLLSVSSDAKTVKGEKQGVLPGILYLSPADMISERLNLCPYAGIAGCKAGCLNTAGRGAFSNVQRARNRKTLFWKQYYNQFMALLIKDIERLHRKADRENMKLAIRLNGTSDIQWEKANIKPGIMATLGLGKKIMAAIAQCDTFDTTIFDVFPGTQFYDYTKIPGRTVPANYHLTFSYSGVAEFQPVVEKQLRHNPRTNLAVVFNGKLPKSFNAWMFSQPWAGWRVERGLVAGMGTRTVINGDDSDVRFNDADGVVVGLTAKGKAKNEPFGFGHFTLKGA